MMEGRLRWDHLNEKCGDNHSAARDSGRAPLCKLLHAHIRGELHDWHCGADRLATLYRHSCAICLFLDDLRAQPLIDPPLDSRAAVVGLVNRAGQLDESWAEIAGPLTVADVVLDPPERFVDRLQLRDQGRQTRRRPKIDRSRASAQGRQLGADMRELLRVADPLGL